MSSTAAPQTVPEPDVEPIVAAAAPPVEDAEPEVERADSGAPMADTAGRPYRRWQALAVLEGVWTGDDRYIEPGALTWRDFPLSLMAQSETAPGHDGAQLAGRIDAGTRVDATDIVDARTGKPYGDGAVAVMLSGVFDSDQMATATADRIAGGFLKGVSVDLSDVEMVDELTDADGNPVSIDDIDSGRVDPMDIRMRSRVTAGRIMGLTATPFPAFEGAFIQLLDDDGNAGPAMAPGQPTVDQQSAAIRASSAPSPRRCLPCESGAMTASAAPVEPPAAWFDNPGQDRYDKRIVITDEGRVYGYVAPWGVCHTGVSGQCVVAPHSAIDYALFTVGSVKTAEGDVVPTGPITLGTGHEMDLGAGVGAAVEHYDNTGTAVADVAVGEDEYGIWFSGALRPDVTPERVRTLRGSLLSGDWRPWGAGRELIAALVVNRGGFPVVRQLVASGHPGAMVACFGAMARVSPEIETVRSMLPVLNAAHDRELRTQEAERSARAERAAGLRSRRLSLRRTGLQARLDTLHSKEIV